MKALLRRPVLAGTLASLGLLIGCQLPQCSSRRLNRVRRVGYLTAASPPPLIYDAFRQGMRDLGYVEGQNLVLEYRDAAGNADRIPDLAAELLRLQIEVIVVAPQSPVHGVREVTEKLPIVVAYGDPLATGTVASLARPGGTVTGLSSGTAELSAKRLQLIKDTLPGVSRVAVLWWTGGSDVYGKETERAARTLGLQPQRLGAREPREFEAAFAAMSAAHAEALVVTPGFGSGTNAIVEMANQWRLPAIFESRLYVEAGGLVAYGPNLADLARRSAAYVDELLHGVKPADLPVQLPTTFEFVVNLKTAQALGLVIPPSMLAQATEILQ